MKWGKRSKYYSEAIRSFALTLHFYSPRAYRFMRTKFNKHLPDVSSMRSWYSNSTGYGEPGINQEALKSLKNLSEQLSLEGKQCCVSIAMDEIHIQKNVSWNEAKNKFLGFITFGDKNENGELPVANQAFVFLVTGLNIQLSVPVAYFFINKLTGIYKAFLMNKVVEEVTKTGVKVVNVVFDGIANNFTACKDLGASFSLKDFRPYFINPIDKTKVLIFLDNCHMLKLTRNRLGQEKTLLDGQQDQIKWQFFEALEKYRVERK